MHPAKRRRIDNASSTLCKPFRSPLKVSDNDCQSLPPSKKDNHVQQASSCVSPVQTDLRIPTKQEQTSSVNHSAILNTTSTTNDDVIQLQRQYSSLTQQLRKLKQDLDVTEHALKIQSSTEKGQLEALILKWRSIARDAADDVFAAAQSRVKAMGGLKAWQDNALRSSDMWHDALPQKQCKVNGEADEDLDEGFEDEDRAKDSRVDKDNEEEEQDQSLTMVTMLRQMNIDPDLLGIDEETQRWIS
ncbi:hypothetical protein H2198_010190 [Neophaeococcomyces mojaviensis]|uniref:Uncharacterized protein n=1 Tax=Neophaeococcomyces mojaviensis TaxID=3383035 RepID=A0ACC2ZSM3_9EURO|nr:hypothetical protein H2198_010190 [Knufia sp. JES_112]